MVVSAGCGWRAVTPVAVSEESSIVLCQTNRNGATGLLCTPARSSAGFTKNNPNRIHVRTHHRRRSSLNSPLRSSGLERVSFRFRPNKSPA